MNIDQKLGKIEDRVFRNGEDVKRVLEISAREARQLEEKERIQGQEVKVVKRISTLEDLNQFKIGYDERERQSELERLRAIRAEERRTLLGPEPQEAFEGFTDDEDQFKIDHQTEDERGHSEELKKHEKGKDQQSELERNLLAVELHIAGSRAKDEKDWRRTLLGPGPHAFDGFTDDEDPLRKSKTGTAPSRTLRHSEDTDDQSTDDQSTDYEQTPSPIKEPKEPQIPPGNPTHDEFEDEIQRRMLEASRLQRQMAMELYAPIRYGTPLGGPIQPGTPLGGQIQREASSPMHYHPYGQLSTTSKSRVFSVAPKDQSREEQWRKASPTQDDVDRSGEDLEDPYQRWADRLCNKGCTKHDWHPGPEDLKKIQRN